MNFPSALVPVYDGPMSDDEVAVAILSTLVALVTGLVWFGMLRSRKHVLAPAPWRHALRLAPLLAVAFVLAILLAWSASDVRRDARYLYMYTAWGAAWIGVALLGLPFFGLSLRDDVVERRNPAAAAAICGLPFAFALVYAGGNVGDGPGWWVVLFSSGLATLALWCLLWLALSRGRASESITVERDLASGVRFALVAVAEALVLGRAAAGDWVSAGATLRDFAVRGWPAFALGVVALAVDATLRPDARNPQRSALAHGVLPGGLLLAAAIAWALALGSPA